MLVSSFNYVKMDLSNKHFFKKLPDFLVTINYPVNGIVSVNIAVISKSWAGRGSSLCHRHHWKRHWPWGGYDGRGHTPQIRYPLIGRWLVLVAGKIKKFFVFCKTIQLVTG